MTLLAIIAVVVLLGINGYVSARFRERILINSFPPSLFVGFLAFFAFLCFGGWWLGAIAAVGVGSYCHTMGASFGYAFYMRWVATHVVASPAGEHLTAEQLANFARGKGQNIRTDSKGETDLCAYCGAETRMLAYTDLDHKLSWPPCCSNPGCIDKWESFPEEKRA